MKPRLWKVTLRSAFRDRVIVRIYVVMAKDAGEAQAHAGGYSAFEWHPEEFLLSVDTKESCELAVKMAHVNDEPTPDEWVAMRAKRATRSGAATPEGPAPRPPSVERRRRPSS